MRRIGLLGSNLRFMARAALALSSTFTLLLASAPTAQAQITVTSNTDARLTATAETDPRPDKRGVHDDQDTGFVAWPTPTHFDGSLDARAELTLGGAVTTSHSDAHANAIVNGDELQYSASFSIGGAYTPNGCDACVGDSEVSSLTDFT